MVKASSAQHYTWPPEYTVKKHRLARSVKLSISAARGLVITTPHRFSLRGIPTILEQHRDWIIHKLKQHKPKNDALPTKIILPALAERWSVEYQSCDAKLALIQRPQRELVLIGDMSDKEGCRRLLIRWAKHRAKSYLTKRIKLLSDEIKLFYKKLTIRDQQTRWGSCSSTKTISLNYKLIFLPADLVDYVIIHELCHLKHLDHSERFWRLLASFDAKCQQHRDALRQADDHLPGWVGY